jgi:hypothetical protein
MSADTGQPVQGRKGTNQNNDPSPPAVRKRFRHSNETPTSFFFGNRNEHDTEGKYVRITGETEGSLTKINPIVLEKILDNIATGHSDCRRNKNGQISFKTKTAQQAKNLIGKRNLQISPTEMITVEFSMIDSLNCSRGTVFGTDLLNIPIDGENGLLPHLKKDGVIAIEGIKTRGKDGNLDFRGLHVLTFDMREPPEEIKVGFLKYTVKKWIPSPMKCQYCLDYGHTKNRCEKGIKLCRKCDKAEHEGQCETVKCHVCLPPKDDHESFSAVCPRMKKEKKICQEKVARNITFAEAKKIVEDEGNLEFASALRQGMNDNRQEINKIDLEQKEADLILEELRRKVDRLKKTREEIQRLRAEEADLITQNSDLAYGLEFPVDDSEMLFDSANENNEDSQSQLSIIGASLESAQSSAPTTFEKSKPVSITTKQSTQTNPKTYELRNQNVPKLVTAEIYRTFNEATLAQYKKFANANPNIQPHFKNLNGKISFCPPVFPSK